MNIFDFIVMIFYFINSFLFAYFIDQLFIRKYRYSYFIVLLLFFILTFINYFMIFDIVYLKTILGMLLVLFCSVFLYSGSTYHKILCPFLLIIAFAVSEVLTALFVIYIFHIPYNQFNNINLIWILIFENICAFIILTIFLKMLKSKISRKSTTYFLAFIITLCPYTLALPCILVFRFIKLQKISANIYIFALILLTFVCDYFLLLQADKLKKQMKLEIVNNLNSQFYLDMLQKSNEFKDETTYYRTIRHDLINYIEKIKLENK